jgi:hypothetical protein
MPFFFLLKPYILTFNCHVLLLVIYGDILGASSYLKLKYIFCIIYKIIEN